MESVSEGMLVCREYDGKEYYCELELPDYKKIVVGAKLPPTFIDAPSKVFQTFEEFTKSFDCSEALDRIKDQFKLVEWKGSTLAECRCVSVIYMDYNKEPDFCLEVSVL